MPEITEDMFAATQRRREAAKRLEEADKRGVHYTFLNPPAPFQPTEKYLNMRIQGAIRKGIAQGQVSPEDYPELETEFQPGAEWDHRTAVTGMKGEPLPQFAQGWRESGKPFWGDGLVGTWNHLKNIGLRAVNLPGRMRADIEEVKDKPFGERLKKDLTLIGEIPKLEVEAAYTIALPLFTAAEDIIQGPFTSLSMVLEERAEPSRLGPIPELTNWDAMPEIVKKDWWNVVERANPIRWGWNMVRTIEAATQPGQFFTLEERQQMWKDALSASMIGWSIGAGDLDVKREFVERVNSGEPRTLVADDLEVPGAQLIGEILFDASGLFGKISKAKKAAGMIDEAGDMLKPAREVVDYLASKGDESASVLRASKNIDEIAETFTAAATRQAADDAKKAVEFGFWKPLSGTKRKMAATEVTSIAQWFLRTAKTPDEALDILKYLAKAVGDDPMEQKMAIASLQKAMQEGILGNPEVMMSEGAIRLGRYMKQILGENPKKLAEEFLKIQETGDVKKLYEFLSGKMGNVIEGAFPKLEDVVKAGDIEDVSPVMKALGKMEGGVPGNVRDWVRKQSGRLFIGLSPRTAMRGIYYDTFQSIVDTDLKIMSKRPRLWADIATRWMGGVEPDGLTKGFSKADVAELDNIITKGTSYKDLPSYLEAVFKPGADVSLLDKATFPFARLMQRFEISTSQKVTGKAIQDAMHQILSKDIMPVDDMVKAGLPEEVAKSLKGRIIDNYGDVNAVRKAFLDEISTGTIDVFKQGQWIPDDVRKFLMDLGLWDDVMDLRKSGKSLDEILESVSKLKDDLLKKTDSLFKQHSEITDTSEGRRIAEAAGELREAIEDGFDLHTLEDIVNNRVVAGNKAIDGWAAAVREIYFDAVEMFERGELSREVIDELSKIFENIRLPHGNATGYGRKINEQIMPHYRKAVKGSAEDFAKFRKEAEEILNINLPKGLSRDDFLDRMFNIMADKKQFDPQGFRNARKATEALFAQFAEIFKGEVSDDIFQKYMNGTEVRDAIRWSRTADMFDHVIYVAGEAKPAGPYIQALLDAGQNERAIRAIAAYSGVTHGLWDRFDGVIKYALQEFGDFDDIDDLSKIDPRKAFDAFQEWRAASQFPKQIDSLDELLDMFVVRATEDVAAKATGVAESLTKNFRAGPYNNTAEFVSSAQKKLYEYGSSWRKKMFGADIPTSEKESIARNMDKLLEELKAMGFTEDEVTELGSKVAEDVRKQMSGKQDEVVELLDNVGLPKTDIPETVVRTTEAVSKTVDDIPSVKPPTERFTEAEDIWRKRGKIEATFDTLVDGIKSNFGKQEPLGVDEDVLKAATAWFDDAASKVNDARTMAGNYGQAMRDFVLHDYGKRYGFDMALSYLFNFHFWPSRTAYKWLTDRLWRHPGLVSSYIDYREHMQKIHADAPEWWKYAINTNEMLGLDMENPLFFRPESLLQPVYFMAGSNFKDPKKRATWWAAMMDDIGRTMPGYWNPLIQYGVATALKIKEEDEAAARWAGGRLPATGLIKSITALLGVKKGKGLDLDPNTALYSADGLGPWERNRVAMKLAQFIKDGKYTEEEIMEAAFTHSGPAWEEAIATEAQQYAKGNLVSLFLGMNTRQRTKQDLQVDKFWADYMKMWSLYDSTRPEELRYNMEKLSEEYPFMDALLLARTGADERDSSYAYAVLSRIRPGKTDDLAEAMGMPYDMISKFYDGKGDWEEWSSTDKDRFMAAVVDMGATLALPPAATRKEWMATSTRYTQMLDEGKELFGDEIWERVDLAYASQGMGVNSQEEFRNFLEENPDVEIAMRWKDNYILTDRLLAAYYGGQEKLRSYYKGKMYQEIEDKLGRDIWDKWSVYWSMRNTGQKDAARAFKAENPELSQYGDLKDAGMESIEKLMLEYGQDLPEGQDMRLREPSEDMSIGEQQLRGALSQPQTRSFTLSEWTQIIGEQETMLVLQDYEGLAIPSDIRDYIQQIAEGMGMTYEELIISIGEAQR